MTEHYGKSMPEELIERIAALQARLNTAALALLQKGVPMHAPEATKFVFSQDEELYRQRCCCTFRGYQITPDPGCPFGKWEFTHNNYDGAPATSEGGEPPADPRHGHCDTLREVYEAILELVEEYPELHPEDTRRVWLCHGPDRF